MDLQIMLSSRLGLIGVAGEDTHGGIVAFARSMAAPTALTTSFRSAWGSTHRCGARQAHQHQAAY